jgi:CheY-like chemotaxis protein
MRLRLLIVDDDPAFRLLARTLLSDAFDVVADAGSRAEALAILRSVPVDLILLDVNLPDGDGFTISRTVTDRADAPRVILMSSDDIQDCADAVAASGAVGFIDKGSLDADVVLRLLRGG